MSALISIALLWVKKFFAENALACIFLGIILALLLYIALPNMDSVRNFFGMETKESLKKDLEVQKQSTETALQAYKKMIDNLDKLEKSKKIAEEIKVKQDTETKEIKKKTESDISKKNDKIEKIKGDSKTPELTKQEIADISTVQINSVWKAYCDFNTSEQCLPSKTT